ncbi:MAG: glycosyltransferase family 2 protein [candidate division WOR-3 bacterium]|nr:glycosyltransferase family 2 protein [candidate division WOR-3 bacterium]
MLKTFILAFYFLCVSGLAFYSSHAYLMLYYYIKELRSRKNGHKKRVKRIRKYPFVTVQIPLYNEKYVAERIIKSVCALDYPKERLEIQVLDDSTDETTALVSRIVDEYRERGYNIKLIHRDNRHGYKAGALQNGLAQAQGEFVAIFDADFIVPRRFLKYTLPYFYQNPKVAAVQTRWGHINKNYSFLTLGQAVALDGHFYMEQKLRADNGFFINFNGTGGVWRKEAIYDAGGWHSDTLTEDLDLSYRAQLKGWRIVFIRDIVVPGEVPVDFNGFRAQQYRWTKGACETARKLLIPLLKSDLPWRVKYEGFIHLTNFMVFPLMLGLLLLSLPVLMLKVEHSQELFWYFLVLSLFTIAVFPYPIIYGITQRKISRKRKFRSFFLRFQHHFMPVFLVGGFMSLSLSNTWAVIKGIVGKPTEFTRTPKFRVISKKDRIETKKYLQKPSPIVWGELLLTLYLLVTTTYALLQFQLTLVPFLLLYTVGYAYLSIGSLYQSVLSQFAFVYEVQTT